MVFVKVWKYHHQHQHHHHGPTVNPPTAMVFPDPNTTTGDDYAKALQEAYRRGAEAAAALSRQQLSGVSAAVSCPNLSEIQTTPPPPPPPPSAGGTTEEPDPQLAAQQEVASRNTTYPEVVQVANPLAPAPSTSVNNGTTMMGVPTPLPHLTSMSLPQPPPPSQPPQPPQPQSTPTPPPSYTQTMAPAPGTTMVAAPAPRSISMPDITSYAARASAEEEKRRKRLARNRASARLRRLRKKNLVDSYEGEVGVLETSLSKLRQHQWGQPSSNPEHQQHEALLDALSMERGQQCIAPDKRAELIYSILDQQREQVQNIMDCQLEGLALRWLSMDGDVSSSDGGNDTDGQKIKAEDCDNAVASAEKKQDEQQAEAEAKQLASELSSILNLTPSQKVQLKEATSDIEEEMRTTATIDSCLALLRANPWLMNKGVEEVTEQFSSILNNGQMSKFLLWTDHNAESIDSLDFVHALPAGNGPGGGMVEQGPVFVFGMDEGGIGHMDEGDEGAKGYT
mmetsp:Transcript_36308/g.53179  ORF Transcript_36308/g.53179 Transcript_36308/m.53179 type:complete len:509 (-) Transcript_36308:857-2383(-)